jgi:predicted PurR-regulated permease PerM
MSTRLRNVVQETPRADSESVSGVALNSRTVALFVLAGSAAMAVLFWAQAVFIPIVLSILIAYALEPLVRAIMRVRLPRAAAAALVVTALAGMLGFTGYALSDDATAIVASLPDAAARLRQTLLRTQGEQGAIQQVQRAAEELQRTADAAAGTNPAPQGVQRVQIEEPAIDVRQYVMWGSTSAVAFAGQAVLVVFFVFFLLASGDLFRRKLVKLAGHSPQRRKAIVEILGDINTQIERYLVVLVVASIIVGVVSWIAFTMVGLKQAGVWAIAAGVFNTVPYFGPVIVSGGTAVVAFLQFGTLSMAAYVAGISLVITSLEGWLLMPFLASRMVRTNEVAVFVALIFWSFVWGVWGTLLAVPMLVAVKACCDHVDSLKPIGELLGE